MWKIAVYLIALYVSGVITFTLIFMMEGYTLKTSIKKALIWFDFLM